MKILFEHQHLYYLPQFEPIIQELKRREVEGIYGSLSESVPELEKKIFKKEMERLGVELIGANFEPQRRRIIKDMNFDLIFVGNKTSLGAIKAKNSFSIMIYHGIGLKQSYYTDLTNDMDLVCVESPVRDAQLQDMGFNSVETGLTKLDLLETVDYDSQDQPSRPSVLYAPTFFPSSLQKSIPFLNKMATYKIQIKLHHFFWTEPKYGLIRQELEDVIKNLDHVYLYPFEDYNILKHFPSSDLLVSDFSSTLFEFLMVNKPIVQATYFSRRFKYRLFPHLLEKRMDREREMMVDFALKCNTPDKLSDLIGLGLSNHEDLSNQRLNACKQFLGEVDGKASQRVVNAIIESGIPIGHRG